MPYSDIALTTQVTAASSSAAGSTSVVLSIAAVTTGPLNRYIFAYCGAQTGASFGGTITLKELTTTLSVLTVFSSSGQHVVLGAPIKTAASNSCSLTVVGQNSVYASAQFAYV